MKRAEDTCARLHKLFLVVVCIGCSLAGVGPARAQQKWRPAPGGHNIWLQVDGLWRSAHLHIPRRYTGQTQVPLLVLLHGRGGNGLNIQRMTRFDKVADREGFVLVCPDADGNPRAWNAFPDTGHRHVDDIAFLKTLIDRMQAWFRIDPHRIYAAGQSSGAMMVYRLGASLGNRLAAIAVDAGSIGIQLRDGKMTPIPEPVQPLSVLVIHGLKDTTVPYDGGASKTGDASFISVPDSVNLWVRRDGCKPEPQTETFKEGRLTRQTYSGGVGGTEVVLYTVADGTHAWPGAIPPKPKKPPKTPPPPPDPDPISATDLVWDFFSHHNRGQL